MRFRGAKAGLICGPRLVVLRRDNDPRIPFPGMIDLPGGGREGAESPAECAARETWEETGLKLDPARFLAAREYERRGLPDWFFLVILDVAETADLRLGDEGQAVWLMDTGTFLAAPDAVPHLQFRLRAALGSRTV